MVEDDILVLEDAVEDISPIWEANWTLGDKLRAALAIKRLFEEHLIEFYTTSKWVGGTTRKLSDAEMNQLVQQLDNESYWEPSNDASEPYLSFGATDAGKNFCKNNESIREYYNRKVAPE